VKTLLETIAEARSLAGAPGAGFRLSLPTTGGVENDPVSYASARLKAATEETDDEFEQKREPIVYVQLDPEDRTLTCGLPTEDILRTIEALADDDEDFFLTGRHTLDEAMLLAIGAVSRVEEAEDFIPQGKQDAELYYSLR
jgi:hypothetical protein